MKEYLLVRMDLNDRPIGLIRYNPDNSTLTCYSYDCWTEDSDGKYLEPMLCDAEFVVEVYGKWDSCTHWWFRGKDYDPEITEDIDSYYHICGPWGMSDMFTYMAFIWKVLSMEHGAEYYNDDERLNNIIDAILKDCKIIPKEVTDE